MPRKHLPKHVLHAEMQRLRRLLEHIRKQESPISIGASQDDAFVATMRPPHWAVQAMAKSFHDSFRESGAVNYFQMGLTALPENMAYVVTIQREDRITPHQFRVQAERERDDALAELAAYKAGLGLLGSAADAATPPKAPRTAPSPKAEEPAATPRVIVNFKAWPRRLECTRCKARQDLPETFIASVFKAMAEAFSAQHKDCVASDQRPLRLLRRPRP